MSLKKKMPETVGPNVPIFQKFRNTWASIDKKSFKTGIYDSMVLQIITNQQLNRIGSFVKNTVATLQPRDDYRELLQLSLIFFGFIPPENFFFNVPGAFRHARWMAKAIYYLKIFYISPRICNVRK